MNTVALIISIIGLVVIVIGMIADCIAVRFVNRYYDAKLAKIHNKIESLEFAIEVNKRNISMIDKAISDCERGPNDD